MSSTYSNSKKDRRKELIVATIHTISEYGFSNVTLANVASYGGLSPGIINFYFKSKRQLLLATLAYLDEEFTDILAQRLANAVTAEQRLHSYVHSCFDKRVFVTEKIATWFAFWSASRANDDYQRVLKTKDHTESQLVLQNLTEILQNSTDFGLNVDVWMRGLQGLVESLRRQMLIAPDSINHLDAIKQCELYLSYLSPTKNSQPIPSTNTSQFSDLLPFWTYQDEEFFELEIEKLFKPNWMLVGHVSEVPETGNYLTFQGLGERALVIRDQDGRLNAFHNVCRHRGSIILTDRGRCRQSLTCPFHGWRYDFNGQLQFVPGRTGFASLDTEKYSLVPLDLEIWHGFVFIRFISGGRSIKDQLAPIEHEIREYQLEKLQPYQEPSQYAFDNPEGLPINWKIYHDIDNEGYHVPTGHPTLQQLYGNSYVDTFVNGIPVSKGRFNDRIGNLWSVRNYRNLMPRFEHLSEERQDLWLYIGVFPNLVLAMYPELTEIYMSIPCTPTHTEVIGRCYALPDNRRGIDALRYLNRRINMITAGEDYFYMNAMQEGLKSSAHPKWTLSQTAETGIRAYHQAIQAQLPVAKLANKPPRGTIAQVNDELVTNGHVLTGH